MPVALVLIYRKAHEIFILTNKINNNFVFFLLLCSFPKGYVRPRNGRLCSLAVPGGHGSKISNSYFNPNIRLDFGSVIFAHKIKPV